MRPILSLLCGCLLALSSCSRGEQFEPRWESSLDAPDELQPAQCDAMVSNICIIRPTPDDFISTSELARAPHGGVLKVEFHDIGGERHASVIINQVVGAEEPKHPSCLELDLPWCEKVLSSHSIFYPIDQGTADAPAVYIGAQVDVIEASPGLSAAELARSAFRVCHGRRAPLTCGVGVRGGQ